MTAAAGMPGSFRYSLTAPVAASYRPSSVTGPRICRALGYAQGSAAKSLVRVRETQNGHQGQVDFGAFRLPWGLLAFNQVVYYSRFRPDPGVCDTP